MPAAFANQAATQDFWLDLTLTLLKRTVYLQPKTQKNNMRFVPCVKISHWSWIKTM